MLNCKQFQFGDAKPKPVSPQIRNRFHQMDHTLNVSF